MSNSCKTTRPRRPRRRRLAGSIYWLLYCACLYALSSALPLAAQDAASSTEGQAIFGSTIDVRAIDLTVVVTDGKDQRVSGLGPQDFRLEVDGQEVAVDFFSEVDAGRIRQPPTGVDAKQAPGSPVGAAVPTNYLIFVDRYFSFKPQQQQLLEALAEDLPLTAPGDRMAVVAYSGHHLETLSGWTDSRPDLRAAIHAALAGEFGGIDRAFEQTAFESGRRTREEFIAEGNDPLLDPIAEGEKPDLQSRNKALVRQLDQVSRAAIATLQGFATQGGRNVVMLYSGGWPYDTVAFLEGVRASSSGLPESKFVNSLKRLATTANVLGYTIYAIDAPINRLGGLELEQHASLDFLADATGGRALKDWAGLDALPTVVEDLRSYYWMGFTPNWNGDGKERKISVEVLRPGLKVRSKSAFRDVPRQQQINELVQSSTLLGGLPSSAPLGLEFGTPIPARKRKVQVPLTLSIPLDSIIMLPTAEGFTARLEIRVSVLDIHGEMNEISVLPFTFSGERPARPGDTVYFETSLLLRNKSHNVVVVVYDLHSGGMVSGSHELSLP